MNDDIIINNGPVKSGPWKILTIIFGVTTVAAAIVAGYFFIANNNASTELSKLRKEAGTASIESSPLANIKTLGFDNSDVTNAAENTRYALHYEDAINLFTDLDLSADGKTLTVRMNTTNVINIYGSAPVAEATITFTQRVSDLCLYMAGQAAGDEVLLFLMEDGTVEYMPIAQAVATGELKSYGTINGLSNIAKFYHASAYVSDPENPGAGSGGITTLAQAINGTIYDLYPFVSAALNPETASDSESSDTPLDNCSPGTNCINNQGQSEEDQ